jgi:hypothetical protein
MVNKLITIIRRKLIIIGIRLTRIKFRKKQVVKKMLKLIINLKIKKVEKLRLSPKITIILKKLNNTTKHINLTKLNLIITIRLN